VGAEREENLDDEGGQEEACEVRSHGYNQDLNDESVQPLVLPSRPSSRLMLPLIVP
jgi:hypothetical protein